MVLTRIKAAVGSFVFLLMAPGIVAGLVPWWLTGWRLNRYLAPVQVVGAAIGIAGLLILLDSFARFVLEGLGTPAPVAPTHQLVVPVCP